jgi:hypothetical protein
VIKSRQISLKGFFLLPIYYSQIILSLPFQFLQFLIYGRQIKNTTISEDPIFILGHYRSGTTYLQKLMVSDQRLGCLTNYDSLFPNSNLLLGEKMQPVIQFLINTLKIKNPFFHNSIVQLSEPAEEDDYLINKASAYSAYWGFVFPKRWREWLNGSSQSINSRYTKGWKMEFLSTLRYATFKNKGKQLVLKSPPNTERVRQLLLLFPKAKFIYIYRNPVHLYYSIRNMWKKAILKFYSLQKMSENALDEMIFEHFLHLIGQYEKDKKLIPKGNLVEISYEGLKEDTFGTMKKIYSKISLSNFELTANDLSAQLELEKDYQNFHFQIGQEKLKQINERWGKYISLWGYEVINENAL